MVFDWHTPTLSVLRSFLLMIPLSPSPIFFHASCPSDCLVQVTRASRHNSASKSITQPIYKLVGSGLSGSVEVGAIRLQVSILSNIFLQAQMVLLQVKELLHLLISSLYWEVCAKERIPELPPRDLPVGATQARAYHGRPTVERQPPWWPITVWIHFIHCSGRALILGCVKSKVRHSAFPRTPKLGRREPTLQAQHTTVPWALAPPALRTGETSGKNKEGTAAAVAAAASTVAVAWSTSVAAAACTTSAFFSALTREHPGGIREKRGKGEGEEPSRRALSRHGFGSGSGPDPPHLKAPNHFSLLPLLLRAAAAAAPFLIPPRRPSHFPEAAVLHHRHHHRLLCSLHHWARATVGPSPFCRSTTTVAILLCEGLRTDFVNQEIQSTRTLIVLVGEYFHIRCGAHIINLIVKDGINDMDDTILKIRDSVKYVRRSPKRLHAFKECVKAMGLDEKKGLNYDVPTRWNSTYIMLRDALLFKDVFQHLASCDPNYTCLPSEDKWYHASDLCQFLKIFYDATNLFSTTKQAVLDPRFKLSYLKYLLGNLDKPDAIVKYEIIESTLHELYAEYKNMYDTDTCNMQRANASSSTTITTKEYKSVSRYGFRAYVNSVSLIGVNSDLDKYLLDPMEEITAEFNILSWWKTNESKYKILAKMARDVLAIPVSTVASESAFSIAGRIINDYRCSTTLENVESLICTQSWIGDANNLCESSHDAEHHFDEEC
ncbi:putative AC transposase [Nymphaea thermarum]|nr:putative AC transposase [Nymphaea thermarum]